MTDDFPTDLNRRAATLLLAGGALALIAAKAPVKPDAPRWSAKLSTTAIGAHVFGNPAAKVQLIEYYSYTCGHCSEFARLSAVPMKALYLDKGLLTFEYRNLVRDPLDMTAALLVRCGGPAAFYANHQAIFAAQTGWLAKAAKMPEAKAKAWYEGSFAERSQRIALDTGLQALMRARGYSVAQINAALDDGVALAEMTAMTNLGQNSHRVTGTPSFLINGKLLAEVHDWAPLKTRLDQAIRAA